jgi:hypothetical protein
MVTARAHSTTVTTKLRPEARHAGGNFGEKDERRVNECITGGTHPA